MMLANSLFDFGLQESVLGIVRIIATIGGAVVGWFVCDPLARILYRLSFRGPTPGKVLVGAKLSGSALLALGIYFFLPLGGSGSGGFGWGSGLGGSPSKGGDGGDQSGASANNGKDAKPAPKDKTPAKQATPTRESVEIEIIKVKLFKKDGKDRYYLLNRAEPALSLGELKEALEKDKPKKISVILTKGGFDVSQADDPYNPLTKLTKMAKEIGIDEISQTQR